MNNREEQKVFVELVLKKNFDRDSISLEEYEDFKATFRLYNKYGKGRTYEQFLKDIVK